MLINNKIQHKKTYLTDIDKSVLSSEKALVLNLLASKGANTKGKLKFVEDSKTFLKSPKQEEVAGFILVLNTIEPSLYPMLSALSVRGIIVNAIDYKAYQELLPLNSSFGVYAGYSNNNDFSPELIEYFKSIIGTEVYIDTLYNRLIIPDVDEPEFLRNYQFDIENLMRYK